MEKLDMFTIRLDLDNISAKTKKHQLFNTKIRIKIVVPDQGENRWRLGWRPYEKMIISSSAQFATHQEMSPEHDCHT